MIINTKEEAAVIVDELGKNKEVKKLILAVFLITIYHTVSRPFSKANDGYYKRVVKMCRGLLELLLEPGWPSLSALEEEGIRNFKIIDTLEAQRTHDDKLFHAKVHKDLKMEFKKYFQTLTPLWSALTPVEHLDISLWDNPKKILFAIGPNIGIGDAVIFLKMLKKIKKRFPHAKLEVTSYYKNLWDVYPEIDKVHYCKNFPLVPYVLGKRVIEEDPNNLVIFMEFAAGHIYRHLEVVPGFDKFMYFDTGSKVARIIDQKNHQITEHVLSKAPTVYHMIDTFMLRAGLVENLKLDKEEAPYFRPDFKFSTPRKMYVNPFSSKDYRVLSPKWWADSIRGAVQKEPVKIEIFEGINETTKAYSRAIAEHLKDVEHIDFIWLDYIPSIAETMQRASDSDLLFGLDTFTGHIGVIKATPCVSVFFGSSWHLWRIPNNHVLNASIYDDPYNVGIILNKMLHPNKYFFEYSEQLYSLTEECLRASSIQAQYDAVFELIKHGKTAITEWFEQDPTMYEFASEIPLQFFYDIESALFPNGRKLETFDKKVIKLITMGMGKWRDSNLYRYATYMHYLAKVLWK